MEFLRRWRRRLIWLAVAILGMVTVADRALDAYSRINEVGDLTQPGGALARAVEWLPPWWIPAACFIALTAALILTEPRLLAFFAQRWKVASRRGPTPRTTPPAPTPRPNIAPRLSSIRIAPVRDEVRLLDMAVTA